MDRAREKDKVMMKKKKQKEKVSKLSAYRKGKKPKAETNWSTCQNDESNATK